MRWHWRTRQKRCLQSVSHLQFLQQVGHMVLDRFVAQPQANADLLVAQALPQQRKNLLFAKAQFANRLLTGNAGASGQGGDDFLIGWAGCDTLNGGETISSMAVRATMR
jgi:hypothetical protein